MGKTTADFQFALNINDDKNSLSPNDGLDYTDLSLLIRSLDAAIDIKDAAKCTLFKIENHGYTPHFRTRSKELYEGFLEVHKNIYEKGLTHLSRKETPYANALNKILANGKYLEPLDNDSKPIFRLTSNEIEKGVETYNSITNKTGIISEIGSQTIKDSCHIYLDGQDYKIYITPEQDEQLSNYYRKVFLDLKLKQKRSINTGKVIYAKLLSYTIKSDKTLHESLGELDSDDLSFMAKEEKKPTEKKKRGKYDDKLLVKGSFLDLMKAAGKDAKNTNQAAKEDSEKS